MRQQTVINILGRLKACRRHMMYPDTNTDANGNLLCRNGCGICFTVRNGLTISEYRSYTVLAREYAKDWVYYTGDDSYPIPAHINAINPEAGRYAYQNLPIWKGGAYAQMRGAYLDYMIDKFSNLRELLT